MGYPVDIRKIANVLTAMGTTEAPGSQNMPGAGYVGAGKADIPNMSVHCLWCGKEIEREVQRCPYCGCDTRRMATSKKPPVVEENQSPETDVAETGAEAAAADEKAKKLAAAVTPGFLKGLLGGAAGIGSVYMGGKYVLPISKKMNEATRAAADAEVAQKRQELLEKMSAARLGNPVLNLRRAAPKTVSEALRVLRTSSKKFRKSMAGKG